MKKIKIAFYKKSKSLFWKWICLLQRLKWMPERYAKYSHTEIVFFWDTESSISDLAYLVHEENYYHNNINNVIRKFWLSFSSSEEDSWVRFKLIEWNDSNWDFIEFDLPDSNYYTILEFCKWQNGNKYNKVWILFAQIFNMNIKKPWTWFCSEIVTYALQLSKMLCVRHSLFTKPWELAEDLDKIKKIC